MKLTDLCNDILIDCISIYLSKQDIDNLRLTCKQLNNVYSDPIVYNVINCYKVL